MTSKQSIENQYGGSRFYNLILLGKLALVCNEKQNKIKKQIDRPTDDYIGRQ